MRARRLAGVVAALGVAAGCGAGPSSGNAAAPPALARLTSGRHALGDDTFEVWVCRVPATVSDPLYVAGGARLDLDPADVAARLDAELPAYFRAISGDRYRPSFVAGGQIVPTAASGHQGCIDDALDASSTAADAVLVVADAEHDGDAAGGLAQPGTGCACPAGSSRRMVYVGASDFHPDWGMVPALDLIEHEIGHTLGLPHSGDAPTAGDAGRHTYSSALDVMSNSAAPRDADPDRRHGPGTIAANLLALGWLDPDAVAVVGPSGDELEVVASNRAFDASVPSGRPAATVGVVALDGLRLLTVELLAATGYDDHLPASGVAVHLIDQSPRACGHADGVPCTGLDRRQIPVGTTAPHTALLTAGQRLTAEGWTVRVTSLAADGTTATVAVTPA